MPENSPPAQYLPPFQNNEPEADFGEERKKASDELYLKREYDLLANRAHSPEKEKRRASEEKFRV
ncbi:MAG: hypothetical protein LBO66_03825 [Deltaproteobacteria bacterium]|jgi:hypothetical protein|nr:hypothetical protein [Deltaproteobacteria bacterium]